MSSPSHQDIFDQVQILLVKLSDDQRNRDQFREATLQRHDALVSSMNEINLRVRRVEAKVLAYDNLKERIRYTLVGAGAMLLVVWWLIKDKLQELLAF